MRKWLLALIPLIGLGFYLNHAEPAPLVTVKEEPKVEVEEVVEPEIIFTPSTVIQGEPVIISVTGTSSVRSINFNKQDLGIFSYKNNPSAMVGIDLRATTGDYPVTVTLSNGEILKRNLVVGKRVVVQAPLGIPDKLGGNTPQAEKELINTLAQEGAIISAIQTSKNKLWKDSFRFPLNPPITITDTYGYSRLTGASSIAHKGTDFRAATGTPVYAMNAGIVRYVGFLRNYGHVVAVDHGTGLLSIYMHLSEVLARQGESVNKGFMIAKSGDTGYVLGPHLHLTIRLNGVSIDPMKFMALLGE
jgi:murein DD-endopeptidase MepM/ murein hydrolase activator NlpD